MGIGSFSFANGARTLIPSSGNSLRDKATDVINENRAAVQSRGVLPDSNCVFEFRRIDDVSFASGHDSRAVLFNYCRRLFRLLAIVISAISDGQFARSRFSVDSPWLLLTLRSLSVLALSTSPHLPPSPLCRESIRSVLIAATKP